MSNKNLASVCGLYCGSCEHLDKSCRGCVMTKGKPFWTNSMKMDLCPLYDCCVNRKKLEHCGMCDEIPCDTFSKFHDPALSPEEAKQAVLHRQGQLLRRKKMGTEQWVREISTSGS